MSTAGGLSSALAVASLAGALALTACASASGDLAVVLPEADGHVGTVVVHRGGDQTVVHGAYAADRLARGSRGQATLDKGAVDRLFGPALAGLPRPPAEFTLHFATGSTDMDAADRAELARAVADIDSRPAPEVVITGHTDTTGEAGRNDILSRDRAETVAEQIAPTLAAHGVGAASLSVAGRGQREPIAGHEGADRDDAANRRVVITVK